MGFAAMVGLDKEKINVAAISDDKNIKVNNDNDNSQLNDSRNSVSLLDDSLSSLPVPPMDSSSFDAATNVSNADVIIDDLETFDYTNCVGLLNLRINSVFHLPSLALSSNLTLVDSLNVFGMTAKEILEFDFGGRLCMSNLEGSESDLGQVRQKASEAW